MTTPGDDSGTELAWREIVENYGERVVLPDDDVRPEADPGPGPTGDDAHPDRSDGPVAGDPYDVGPDEPDGPDERVAGRDEVAEVDRFRPPAPPPLPRPRTWQRGVAWTGVRVSPLLARGIAMCSRYCTPRIGWTWGGSWSSLKDYQHFSQTGR